MGMTLLLAALQLNLGYKAGSANEDKLYAENRKLKPEIMECGQRKKNMQTLHNDFLDPVITFSFPCMFSPSGQQMEEASNDV